MGKTTRPDHNMVRRDTWLAILGCALVFQPLAKGEERDEKQPMVDYVIVVTGGELLAGAYPDGHTAFITRTLRPLGFRCLRSMIVDDTIDAIAEGVREARSRAKLVIVTGGLGPTPDDVTRDAISTAAGIPLHEHPELIAELERRFRTKRDQLRANLRRQTEVPVRGGYLDNPNGTAAGLVFEDGDGLIVAVPGPPREMQPMVRDVLVPRLTERFGTRVPGYLLTIRFVGIGESQIAQTIAQHVTVPQDVTVASLFEGMRVDFYFTMPGATPDDQARLEQLRADVLHHLGEYVYSTDGKTLEEHVVALLAERHETLAVAEVGSGGSLVAALGSGSVIDKVLVGAYVAPDVPRLWNMIDASNAAKDLSTAPSPAAALAERLAQDSGATLAVALVASRTEGAEERFLEAAFRHEGHTETQRLAARGTGELARIHMTTQLLEMIRRYLKEH